MVQVLGLSKNVLCVFSFARGRDENKVCHKNIWSGNSEEPVTLSEPNLVTSLQTCGEAIPQGNHLSPLNHTATQGFSFLDNTFIICFIASLSPQRVCETTETSCVHKQFFSP